MKTRHGLRRYLYEYVAYDAIDRTREATGLLIPISQAKAIRRRVDEKLADVQAGLNVAHPDLGVSAFLTALDGSIQELIPGAPAVFEQHQLSDPRFQQLQAQFMHEVGVDQNPRPNPMLPISPYDPVWSQRQSVKNAGSQLSWIPDDVIVRDMEGETDRAALPEYGTTVLWTRAKGSQQVGFRGAEFVEVGPAMTDEDAAGLTVLRDYLSVRDYSQVRNWVVDGGRDPRTGKVDRNRFMSPAALERSVAMLAELQAQGIGYEVVRDQNPGQIKARVTGTSMEIRLTEPRHREDYAGARIYDDGVIVRYSTNYKMDRGKMAVYSPTPEEAVALLRFAQGHRIERQDLPGVAVGTVGSTHFETGRGPNQIEVQDNYHLGKDSMFAVKDFVTPGGQVRPGSKVMLRREAADRTLSEFFVGAEPAERYLQAAVDSARTNMRDALDVPGLFQHFEAQRAEGLNLVEFAEPEYSGDPEIAAIQRSYWDVLTGNRVSLLRPGATAEMFEERLGMIGELASSNDDIFDVTEFGNLVYGGSPREQVENHADEVVDTLIGTLEPVSEYDGDEFVVRRFDPIRVSRYMTSGKGQWSNLDELGQALRRLGVSPDEMRGSGFQVDRFKDRLVRFAPETAQDLRDVESPFLRQVGETVRETLSRNGVDPERIDAHIDSQGVIQWHAHKVRRNGETDEVTGYLGQVFDIGEHGEIVTKFLSGDNSLIVPGYEARIAAQLPGEMLSVEERTVLRGYSQLLTEQIQYRIANDLLSGRSEVGEGASLNGVYSQLYGTKHPVDFIERASSLRQDPQTGRFSLELDEWTASIIETEARRVRYSNEIKQGSTIFAEYQASKIDVDPLDDNHFDPWRLTGGRNMAVLTGTDASGTVAPGGYFDPIMTGGAINQGIVRYLTTDAFVNEYGRITPGDPETATGSRTPLMLRQELETMKYDPFDRQQMTASTLMQSSSITEPTGTAMMTFGGWTADDPIVISKEFAEENQIRGAGGKLRELVVGDKLSDLHGNKGVISLIIDRDMDLEEARAQDLENEVAWFKKNSGMHVVMSPFSLISRRNAGSARELMAQSTRNLDYPFVDADGTSPEPIPGGLGQMRFIVTHMAVDEKTKVYDEEAVLAGKGRKASSQLAWALGSQDCQMIMQEFYGGNTGAEANLREYLLSVGLDMEADGTLNVVGREADHRGVGHELVSERAERRLFEMPELIVTSTGGLHTTAMRRGFGQLIGDKGGDLEIPFPLTYPTGEQTQRASGESWRLPVLSSHLRSGQEFDDGSVITHDYTNRYVDIFELACRYRAMASKLADGSSLQQMDREKLVDDMSDAVARAQRNFDAITTDLENRVFSGKHNIFRAGLMSSRLPDSATAVWTADPRLDIDEVALSPVIAEQLGLAEGDHALVWRDPILRDAGLRYLRVAIDDRLTGVAINPVMDKSFDGDFDGDAVAIVKLHTAAAKEEAMQKLTVPANLLDKGVVNERGQHPLAMQVSLDTQVALHKNPEQELELISLLEEAHSLEADRESGVDDEETTIARQEDVTEQLSEFYRTAQRNEFGSALVFSDLQSHLNSVRDVCVTTKAKGSQSKLMDYARYLGGESGRSGINQEDQEASMFATAIKAHGTGLGGSYSQRAVRALRNTDLEAVLEVTYPVTQSILQAKHDAAEARHKYGALQGAGRDLWRGRLIERGPDGEWQPSLVDGKPVQASQDQWVAQFQDFYQSKDGFGVTINPAYVVRVANALADPKSGTIRNLEEDPSLAGTLMDRMAYGGTLKDVIAAADNHENLFDGKQNELFCSVATRRARGVEVGAIPEPVIADSLVKSDVMAPDQQNAQQRGSRRRSSEAVAVRIPAKRPGRPTFTPTIPIDEPMTDSGDHGLGS